MMRKAYESAAEHGGAHTVFVCCRAVSLIEYGQAASLRLLICEIIVSIDRWVSPHVQG